MARRIGAAVALAIVAIVILWWRCRDPRARHESKRTSNHISAKESREHAVDPRKLARASIDGTIRDELAAPIVGAVVCADVRARSLSAELQREPRCTRSDARGSYKLGELYVASYAVTATAKGFRPQTYGTEEDPWFRLAAGEARTGVD